MSETVKKAGGFFKGLKNGAGLKIIIVLGAAGMFLILLSEIMGQSDDKKTIAKDGLTASYGSYTAEMEKELRDTLEKIQGVGKAEVMITAGGTEEYIYAQEEKSRKSEKDSSLENEYVLIGSGGDKQALLKKVLTPEITGVAIICEGGDSSIVKERIYSTVTAVFGISSDKIYVTKLR